MRMLVPRFPGFLSKVLELAGAGLASAIGAFLLSQMVSKPAPTAPAPQLVQLAPADAALIGIVRADQAALLAELQKVVPEAAPPTAAPAPKAAAAAPPKPVKTAQPVPLPREKADAGPSGHRQLQGGCGRAAADPAGQRCSRGAAAAGRAGSGCRCGCAPGAGRRIGGRAGILHPEADTVLVPAGHRQAVQRRAAAAAAGRPVRVERDVASAI